MAGAAGGAPSVHCRFYRGWAGNEHLSREARAAKSRGPRRLRADLTPDQRTQVNEIFEDARKQLSELRKESEPRFREVRKNTDERLQTVLTPEQWDQFQQMTARRNRQHDRPRRGGGQR